MTYTLTDEQLEVLIEQKVESLLAGMGQIPAHITARAAWKICGSRAKFEQYCAMGLIKPVSLIGYKAKRYLRSEVIRATKGIKEQKVKSQKIRL